MRTKKNKIKHRRVNKYSVIVVPDNRAKVWRWEISRKRLEAALGSCVVLVMVLTSSIWGMTHYRSAYLVTEDIRVQNAEFEQERLGLLNKLSNLEMQVEKTNRFANRLESTLGINDGVQKGIGPLMENDLAEPVSVRGLDNLKIDTSDDKVAFADLSLNIEGLGSKVSEVDERLHAVYEFNQDRLTYWASIPSIWPTKGWVTSGFGKRKRPLRGGTRFHKGIDIAAPSGTPILCPGDGMITFAGYKGGLGKVVIVDHGYGVVTVYGHNSKNYVKEGDRVKRGEVIGSVGSTGLATGSHLHYQVEVDGLAVDPMRYIMNM